MKSYFLLFLAVLFFYTNGFSQNEKTLQAIRVSSPPKIDGLLDDEVWQNVPVATDFIQSEPNPGTPSSQKTEVKIVYDNSAIYVGAMLYDHPDSILKEMAKRDDGGNNADQFSVLFDTYNDDLNGFAFMVSASNVQTDVKFSDGGESDDDNWNAVWESKTRIAGNGWIVEMKIPYSALRFPKKEIQEWGLQLMRVIRRYREEAFWTKLDPTSDNFIKQSGKLTGISNIESPLRLSFTPYISYSLEHYPYNIPDKSNYSHSVKGGMDLKYGLNDAFTLDMTLIPDFGQVKSDNKILNLSPFEVEYEERRPFFTEGTELFNRDRLFYSRRIGATPSGYDVEDDLNKNESVIDNPKETQLYNATKISGRNRHGLGIGFFNAVTAKMYATVENDSTKEQRKILTEPLTNYNILVFDKTLKNNSSIGILNANTTRVDGDRNANVTGLNLRLVNGENSFALFGNGAVSQIFTKNFLTNNYENETGFKYNIALSKISGRFQFELWENLESDTYDPNDLGLLFSNNEFSNGLEVSYQNIKPFWKIQKIRASIGGNHEALYTGTEFAKLNFFGNLFVNFKNYFTNGLNFSVTPVDPVDYYEPRVPGRFFVKFANIGGTYWYSTDYRKRIAFDGNIGYNRNLKNDGSALWFSIGPRIRISDRMSFNYNFEYSDAINDLGFADLIEREDIDEIWIYFGKRDILTIKNSFNTNYIFSPKMYLSLEAYHNWTRVEYFDYFLLEKNGKLAENYAGYIPDENNNYNAFNVDFTFSWEFSPGSTMSIVYKNIIENESGILIDKYTDDFSKTLDLPQSNSISIKILYYLDYLKLKRKKK